MIEAQRQVYTAVNAAMVTAYWNIGKAIYESCGENDRAAYGKQVLKYISERLTEETHLSDKRWETFKDADRYIEQGLIVRYKIVCAVHGPAAGRAFMERNVDMDRFRLMLVQEYRDEENYAGAEQLCLERLARDEEYTGFLAELKDRWSAFAYIDILAQENETALLMEQVRAHQEAAFLYGNILIPQHGEEVYDLCAAVIRREAEHINSRKDYQMLCKRLRSLAEFGGTAAVRTLIYELRQAYPRRRALLEELEQVERKAADK